MESIKVSDYMSRSLLTFSPDEGVIEALRRMLKAGRSGGPVVGTQGELLGVLSEIDCLKETLMGGYFQQGGDRVADHMVADVDVVDADDNILSTTDHFLAGRRRLPVTSDGRLVGIITREDLARALIYRIDHPTRLG